MVDKIFNELPKIHKLQVLSNKSTLFFLRIFRNSVFFFLEKAEEWFTCTKIVLTYLKTLFLLVDMATNRKQDVYVTYECPGGNKVGTCKCFIKYWVHSQTYNVNYLGFSWTGVICRVWWQIWSIYLLSKIQKNWCTVIVSQTIEYHSGNQWWDQMPGRSQHPLIGAPHQAWIYIQRFEHVWTKHAETRSLLELQMH